MNGHIDPQPLPALSEDTIRRIETDVFGTIADETPRRPVRTPHPVRRRWLTAAGIAAAFVVGVMITPPLLGGVTNTAGSSGAVPAMSGGQVTGLSTEDMRLPESESLSGDVSSSTALTEADREIIATGSVTLEVSDIADAADEIAEIAEDAGGYVESTSIGVSPTSIDSTVPVPPEGDYGWVTIRVPSGDLASVVATLGDTGDVLSSSISKQDVTSTAIDLQARIDATRTSVQRLTALMAQSASVSELIEAEVALTDRQAQLESYEQQLAALNDQVAMSSLQVQLTHQAPAASADPAGFGDGLAAGWNGLVVSLNAVVIAIGFVLPWLAIAAVIVLLVWGIRRVARRRGRADSEG